LLQEYFLFPQKFHFFDIEGLEQHRSETVLDILILLDQFPPDRIQLRRSTFVLGCTPAINLFRNTTEPIRVDQRQFEYRLVGDYRKERTTEIHSIQAVSASANPAEPTTRIEPFFSNRHRLDGREGRAWWYARRVPTEREDLPGTDILLSFVDLDFDPTTPPSQVVYAHTLCTNRDFAVQIPSGGSLQIEDAAPLMGIACLNKPTAPVYPPLGGSTLWRLVSNLTLNFLSFSSGPESLEALREILRLYSFSDQPWVHQQIQGISDMETRPVTRRIGRDGWRGFCYGTEVTLTFDESLYVGTGSFLLSAVLNRFFGLYASINSFTELVVKSRQRAGVWKRWAPMTGTQPLV
jgi:type VI secretion system protein ImpG